MAATKRKKKKARTPSRNGKAQAPALRNRVVERRKMLGAELLQNPRNWRTHGTAQAATLRAILEEVGMAGELLAYHSAREGGKLILVDGHLRARDFADQLWDVAVTDLDDAEAAKLLLAHDPIASMAGAEKDRLDALLRDVQTGSDALAGMLTELAAKSAEEAIRDMAAVPPSPGAEANEQPTSETEYKQFTIPLTITQEREVRAAIKEAKSACGAESSGEALYFIVQEWMNARSP